MYWYIVSDPVAVQPRGAVRASHRAWGRRGEAASRLRPARALLTSWSCPRLRRPAGAATPLLTSGAAAIDARGRNCCESPPPACTLAVYRVGDPARCRCNCCSWCKRRCCRASAEPSARRLIQRPVASRRTLEPAAHRILCAGVAGPRVVRLMLRHCGERATVANVRSHRGKCRGRPA